ncbi:hypothetical protein T484DRAFT_1781958, partial [Baffinella frigidus]
ARQAELVEDLEMQHIGNLAWSLACLLTVPPAHASLHVGLANRLSNTHIGNLAWSLACLLTVPPLHASLHVGLANRLSQRIMTIGKEEFDTPALVQLHQFFLSCQLDPSIRAALPQSIHDLKAYVERDARFARLNPGYLTALPQSIHDLRAYIERDARDAFSTSPASQHGLVAKEVAAVLRMEFPWMRIEEMAPDMATGYVVAIRFGSAGRTHLKKPDWAPAGASGWILEVEMDTRFMLATDHENTGLLLESRLLKSSSSFSATEYENTGLLLGNRLLKHPCGNREEGGSVWLKASPALQATEYENTGLLLGNRLLKYRHLARVGYTVMSVAQWDWQNLGTLEAKQQYLQWDWQNLESLSKKQQYLQAKFQAVGRSQHFFDV